MAQWSAVRRSSGALEQGYSIGVSRNNGVPGEDLATLYEQECVEEQWSTVKRSCNTNTKEVFNRCVAAQWCTVRRSYDTLEEDLTTGVSKNSGLL